MTLPCRGPAIAASFGFMETEIIPNRIALLSFRIAARGRFSRPSLPTSGHQFPQNQLPSTVCAEPPRENGIRRVPGTSLALEMCRNEGWQPPGVVVFAGDLQTFEKGGGHEQERCRKRPGAARGGTLPVVRALAGT